MLLELQELACLVKNHFLSQITKLVTCSLFNVHVPIMATFLIFFILSFKQQIVSFSFLNGYRGGSISYFGSYFHNDIVYHLSLA